jgi:hypothetical protein
MSNSSKKARVVRKHNPKECFTESTYREKSFDKLMEDFGSRCAYSMLHVERVSQHNMEVDHHNPEITGKKLHAYGNLYPAFSLCNNSKSGVWPKPNQRKQLRQRYLDPCKETDYGAHIFEDLATGTLLSDTPEGIYHIENLDLNNQWLKARRLERTEDKGLLSKKAFVAKDSVGADIEIMRTLFARVEKVVDFGIKPVPSMPNGRVPL